MLLCKVFKKVVIVAILLAFAMLVNGEPNIIISSFYSVGDPVHIRILNSSELNEFWISHGNFTYQFPVQENITFIALSPGRYVAHFTGKRNYSQEFAVLEKHSELKTDKANYYIGETVLIDGNLSLEGFRIEVEFENATYVLLDQKEKISFIPIHTGDYLVRATFNETSYTHMFSVIQRPFNVSIQTDKDQYELGEEVKINLPSIDGFSLQIRVNNETLNYLGQSTQLVFTPRLAGYYNVILTNGSSHFAKGFEVYVQKKAEIKNEEFETGTEVVLRFNLSDKISQTKNILNILFSTSPVQTVSALVSGQENEFNITVSFISPEVFDVTIESRTNKAGDYIAVVEVLANNNKIVEARNFSIKAAKLKKQQENLSEIFHPSFMRGQDAVLHVDLSEQAKNVSKSKTILDSALRRSAFDDVTAFVSGHEFNPNFNLSIEHLGNDEFLIEIQANENIKPDIYSVEIIAKKGDNSFRKNVLFNFGIEDSKVLRARLDELAGKSGKKSKREISFRTSKSREKSEITLIEKEDSFEAEIIPNNKVIKKIQVWDLRINGSLELGIEEVPTQKIPRISDNSVVSSFAIDPSSMNFTSATVTVLAKGSKLYKCKDWNFENQQCLGSWEYFMDVVPGNEYTFELSSQDPGFAETGLASINTLKSIYQPGEEAEIVMVVLDPSGRLAYASVVLNVTSPSGSSTILSTSSGSITQTERGIYRASYAQTSDEGNYSLEVSAIGSGINNSMFSFFSVRQDIEFDIFRLSPFTTDPWKGPFTSSITIVSYSAESFDFIEFLPDTFSISQAPGATITSANGKKSLRWNSLQNNSVIYYTASPPLITPELWELGPAQVEHSSTFVEARPWFLAVDPVGDRAVISLFTLNNTYKQNEYVNISTSRRDVTSMGLWNQTTTSTTVDHINRSCSDAFGFSCGGSSDDTLDNCTQGGSDADNINDVFINVTRLMYTEQINVTCAFDCGRTSDSAYIYYRNSSSADWRIMLNTTCTSTALYNHSIAFNVDDLAGVHNARCIFDRDGTSTYCATSGGTGANDPKFDNDDINFSVAIVDVDGRTDARNYSNFGSVNYTKLADLDIWVRVNDYNRSASILSGNNNPDIEVLVYDGADFSYNFTCNVSNFTAFPKNCTRKLTNATILNAWKTSDNRRLQVTGIFIDFENGSSDIINWSDVAVEFETPSKIENYGTSNLTAFLLMRVDYLNGSVWNVSAVIHNASINFSTNTTRNITSYWNNNSFNISSRILGKYKAVLSLTNATGDILLHEDSSFLNDSYEFNISYVRIIAETPINGSTIDATDLWLNISLNYTYVYPGGTCFYSLSGGSNFTMTNDSATHFYNLTNSSESNHNVTFYCNDSENFYSTLLIYFNTTDTTSPTVNLTRPNQNAELSDGNVTFIYNVSDRVSQIVNCTLELQDANNRTNFTITKDTAQYFNVSMENGGPYTWRVFCFDNSTAKNIGYSVYRSFLVGTDTDNPSITLSAPIDNYNTSNNDVKFTYRVNDPSSSIANCSLIINSKINQTNTTIIEQGAFPFHFNNFTVYDLGDALYNWSVNCTDNSQAANRGASATRKLNVTRDTDFPFVTLINPETDYVDSDGDMIFYYNVTDASSNIINCSLIINQSVNTTTSSPSEGTTNSFTVNGFRDGSYNWSVRCADDSFDANTNFSLSRNFVVNVLLVLVVRPAADKLTYEQGASLNETIYITINSTDSAANQINVTSITDFISGNTTLRWWNSSWLKRVPILLNESTATNRSRVSTVVNLTSLSGSINNCSREIRILENNSLAFIEKPSLVVAGDDQTYCTVVFNANISTNISNQNNYFAYYNFSEVALPSYSEFFNRSATHPGYKGYFVGSVPDTSGVFTSTYDDNNTYWALGTTSNTNNIEGYAEIIFNLTELNITEQKIRSLAFNLTYCHSGEDTAPDCDGDDSIEGTRQGGQNIFLYDYVLDKWVDIGDLDFNNNELDTNSSYSVSLNITSYMNDTSRESKIRLQINYSTGIGLDSWLVIDKAWITAFYDAKISQTAIAQEQKLLNMTINDTLSDGLLLYNQTTTALPVGWHSIISFVMKSSYNNASNFTNIEVVTDRTPPSVKLVNPQTGNKSFSSDMIFLYNVSDTFSSIRNCTLIINSTIINQTNASRVSETLTNNFTVTGFNNANYSWNVNCSDDSLNFNIGSNVSRNFTVAYDTTPPLVLLTGPINNYADTNGNVYLNYTVLDDISETADCDLYLNGTLNATQLNVLADGSTQTFQNLNLSNGGYSWFVNCTDDSANRNSNRTDSRNFTVANDATGPVINLIYPENYAQVTNGNVTFKYNVSDTITGIANCSIYINGTVNQTNTTVIEDVTMNFTVLNLDGRYNWSVRCFDNSENFNNVFSENRTLLVAPDNEGPNINLEFPPNNIQLNAGRITFSYNVSDIAAGVMNCSLFLNNTLNMTNTTITEATTQNFSLNLTNGDYVWYINCSDDSANYNSNKSTLRNLTIGDDITPPDISLVGPINNHNDTNGNVLFQYTVNDVGSAIANCSLIINGIINMTNTTVEENINQNFSVIGFRDGNYTWSVNCSDTIGNRGNSSSRNFSISNDNIGPLITLVSPLNKTWDSNGNRTFAFTVTDAISTVANCSIILFDKVNVTNITITEGALTNITINNIPDGMQNWSINCTDSSENSNVNSSIALVLNVTLDFIGPNVTLVAPPNNSIENDGLRIFSYNVTDSVSDITSCTAYIGELSFTNNTVTKGITQNISASLTANGEFFWNVSCTDASENANVGTSVSRNLSVLLDSAPPIIRLMAPENASQYLSNNVVFFYNVSDTSDFSNCSLILNNTLNITNATRIDKNTRLNFTLNLGNGSYLWKVNCTDSTEGLLRNTSEERLVMVSPDIISPIVTLLAPANESQDVDGNVIFKYNVTDFASGVANCSLIFNGTINVTNSTIVEDTTINFSIYGIRNGDYLWSVNCTDNATSANRGASEERKLNVGFDSTPPNITLVRPANNSIVNENIVRFEYNAVDSESTLVNCSLLLNGVLNVSNSTINDTSANFFGLVLLDSNYTWRVNCTDYYNNSRLSPQFNFSVFNASRISADIFTNQTSYESGQMINITANATNATKNGIDASIYVDVIQGNTTVPWWNSDWKYRIPISVNATNVTRLYMPISYEVNFSLMFNDLGRNGRYLDNNSIRVVEFIGNQTIEVVSQVRNDSSFNNKTNAILTIYWLMNGTSYQNTVRTYFIYFDDSESPKAVPSYIHPNYTYVGSSHNVSHNGTTITADYVVMSSANNAFSLRFSRGDNISNQQNIDYAGAGSIYNISIGADRLTNLNDSIVPLAVYDNYFLKNNETSYLDAGPVFTKVRIPSYVNASRSSIGELNYTIWFTGNEILIKADLYVNFTQANNDPPSLYNNIWFAYLFDYESNWGSYVNDMNSSSFYKQHRYRNSAQDDTTNQFNEADWYSEYDSAKGSINFFIERFMVNSANGTKGIITFDDYYSVADAKTDESDGTGFNFGSDQAIALGDDYTLTTWMLFSANKTFLRAIDLKNSVESPVNITRERPQLLFNRTSRDAPSSGIVTINLTGTDMLPSNYTTTVIANKSLYIQGIDYYWFIITPDVTKPAVSIERPIGFNNSNNVTFFYNVTDLNNVTNCTLILNRISNQTNYSITKYTENYFTVFNFTEGLYNWSVNCSDKQGNIGNSTLLNITIDLTKPYINITTPANGTLFSVNNVTFNFSVFDNYDSNITCDLRVDSRLNHTNLGVANNSFFNVTVLGLNQGTHMWNVTCEDNATNQNTSESRYFSIDLGAPTITLNYPQNSTWNNSFNATFYYTPSDLSGIGNCSLIVNNVINQTNISAVYSDQQNNFTIQVADEKVYEWTVNCTDATGSRGTATPYTLYIDRTSPYINLTYPLDGNITSNSSVTFNFTVTDGLDPGMHCNVSINGTINNTAFIDALNNTETIHKANGFIDGTFFWNVTCIDNATNVNTSLRRNFTVREPPKIVIREPNGTRTKSTNNTFNFTATDNTGVIQSCQLNFNGVANQTNNTVESGILAKIKVQNMPDGQYNWTVNCTDRTLINVMNSTNFTFVIDNQGPSISLITPTEDQAFNTPDVAFEFTPTDQFGANITLFCNITLDNVVNVTNLAIESGRSNYTIIPGLSQGNHNWSVTCLDDLNNSASSIMVNFTVNAPDVTLNDTHIKINSTSPEENRNVTINATIFNIGGTTAIGTKVRFYDGDPDAGGVQIGSTFNISSIVSGANAQVNFTYAFSIGKHFIYVKLDNETEIAELNETNNKANTSLIVPLWNTVYGNITGDLILESTESFTVYKWNTTVATTGNVFVIDYDSSVTWTNLTALGINSTGDNTTDDFDQLDLSLNTTGYFDSVNRTYIRNGVAINRTTFTIFSRQIMNVSIFNSTNSTTFFTGILWDSSDPNNGSYNGSQDVVFASNVVRASEGKYGIADFEMRVPAKLRQLKTSDTSTITFYLELK